MIQFYLFCWLITYNFVIFMVFMGLEYTSLTYLSLPSNDTMPPL